MTKTLEDAIGCWTTSTDWPVLIDHAQACKDTARKCKRETQKGNAKALMDELKFLKRRIESLEELADSAINRLTQIIETNELADV